VAFDFSGREFQALYAANEIALLGLSRECVILFWNRGAKALFGFEASEVVGKPPGESLLAGEDEGPFKEALALAFQGATQQLHEQRTFNRFHEPLYVDCDFAPTKDEKGAVLHVIVVCRDVTRAFEVGKLLVNTGERLEAIFNSTNDGLLLVDPDWRILAANRRFGEIFNLEPAKVVGKSDLEVRRIVMSQFREPEQFMQEVDSIMQRWDFTGTQEMWLTDGRLIERYTAPVKDQAGNNLGRLWVFHDATLQYEAEMALETQLLHVSSLYALSRELTAKLSLEDLYQVLFESVSQRLNLDSFFIHLYHSESENEEIETVMLVDRVDETFRRFEPGRRIPLSQSFCEPVVHQKKPILLNRPEPKAHEALLQPFGNVKRRSRSLMFVPMLDGERVIGVLSAQSYTPDAFAENELQFFAGIANQAALAFSNAHLIEELRNKNEELLRVSEESLKAKRKS